jgi:hypothetical protein
MNNILITYAIPYDICLTNCHATTLLYGFQTKRYFKGLEKKSLLCVTSHFTVNEYSVANFTSYTASLMLTIQLQIEKL